MRTKPLSPSEKRCHEACEAATSSRSDRAARRIRRVATQSLLWLAASVGILMLGGWGAFSAIDPGSAFSLKLVQTLQEHSGEVWDVAFSPDGSILASSGDDRCVRLWNTETWEEIAVLRLAGRSSFLNSLSFSPDGQLLACPDGVWDLSTRVRINRFVDEVMHVAFSPDGQTLAIGIESEPFRVLDVTSWETVATFESLSHTREAADASFGFEYSPGGVLLVDGTVFGGAARLWDVHSGRLLRRLPISPLGTDVHDVAFSSDGSLIAAGGHGTQIYIFRTEDGTTMQTIRAGEGTMSLDFSPDGQLVASVREKSLELWSVDTGRRLRLIFLEEGARSVTFSPDGAFIASGLGEGRVHIWTTSD